MSFIAGFIVGVLAALIGCMVRLAFLADAWFKVKDSDNILPPS